MSFEIIVIHKFIIANRRDDTGGRVPASQFRGCVFESETGQNFLLAQIVFHSRHNSKLGSN